MRRGTSGSNSDQLSIQPAPGSEGKTCIEPTGTLDELFFMFLFMVIGFFAGLLAAVLGGAV